METQELLRAVESLKPTNNIPREKFVTFLVNLIGYDPDKWEKERDEAVLLKRAIKQAYDLRKSEHVRQGSDIDATSLRKTFIEFGYESVEYENLEAEELHQTLKNLAKDDWTGYASVVVCLLSHGGLGTICGVDSYREVNVMQLQHEVFNSVTCPGLEDKPKIFIIQGCQGNIGQRMIFQGENPGEDGFRNNPSHYPTTLTGPGMYNLSSIWHASILKHCPILLLQV